MSNECATLETYNRGKSQRAARIFRIQIEGTRKPTGDPGRLVVKFLAADGSATVATFEGDEQIRAFVYSVASEALHAFTGAVIFPSGDPPADDDPPAKRKAKRKAAK